MPQLLHIKDDRGTGKIAYLGSGEAIPNRNLDMAPVDRDHQFGPWAILAK
jgi:hypothetical protein